MTTEAPAPYRVVVELWVAPGQDAGFRRFEETAFAVMRSYGAQVSIERPAPEAARPGGGPDEIHVLDFPDQQQFEAYRRDRRMADLAALRARSIVRTNIKLPN